MNTSPSSLPNKELCQKLYELSGWGKDSEKVWRLHKPSGLSEVKYRAEQEADDYRFRNNREAPRYREENEFWPLFDLAYILDKLPHMVTLPGLHYVGDTKENRFHLQMDKDAPDNSWVWSFYYLNGEETEFYSTSGDYEDTALNAALRLTIALFENGVLTKGAE